MKKDYRKIQKDMELLTAQIRLEIFKLWKENRAPIAGSLSIVDIYAVLFFRIFTSPEWKTLKILTRIIPKTTSANALYAVLKYAGLSKKTSESKKHPTPVVHKNQWIGDISGTLTKNLDQGVGLAFFSKFNKDNHPVIVFLGEGDLQSGIDHQAKLASAWGLNNLVIVLDSNNIQSAYKIDSVDTTLRPNAKGKLSCLKKIWNAYGWDYMEANGHDYRELEKVMRNIGQTTNPLIIVAKTIKGKGVPFIEKNPIKYTHKISDGELAKAINYLSDRIENLTRDNTSLSMPIVPNVFNVAKIDKNPLSLPSLNRKYENNTKDVLKDWVVEFCRLNIKKVFVLNTDNPYPFKVTTPIYPQSKKSQHLFVGVNEKVALNMARGIANAGGFPIYISPATHLQVCAEDLMHCSIDNDPILLVGFRPGSELAHWGLTHGSNRDSLLFAFPNVSVFQPSTIFDVTLILNSIYKNPALYLPAYLRLPTRIFNPKENNFIESDRSKAFEDGFYYFSIGGKEIFKSRVVFISSGSVLQECSEAILQLKEKGIECLLINVLNLKQINNSKLLNKLIASADIVISVIDADPMTLSGLLFKTVSADQRGKIMARGLDSFGQDLYNRPDILKLNKIDTRSLVELALEKLSFCTE
ncbi:MAG: hypothetical protein U9M92_01150 [Patescibacteria group bacterium]|nr:hypothetical protein [Patescibacteria group bacterium]